MYVYVYGGGGTGPTWMLMCIIHAQIIRRDSSGDRGRLPLDDPHKGRGLLQISPINEGDVSGTVSAPATDVPQQAGQRDRVFL